MIINKISPLIQNQKDKSIHPVFAIGVAILIAIIISSATFVLFLKSDAFELVRLTHNTAQKNTINNQDNMILDDKSPLSSDDLNMIKNDSTKELELLNDEVDFNSNNFSDAALGL